MIWYIKIMGYNEVKLCKVFLKIFLGVCSDNICVYERYIVKIHIYCARLPDQWQNHSRLTNIIVVVCYWCDYLLFVEKYKSAVKLIIDAVVIYSWKI